MVLRDLKIKKFFIIAFFIIVGVTVLFYWSEQYDDYNYYGEYYSYEISCPRNSNVALIKIQGTILTYGDYFNDYNNEEIIESDITSSEKIVKHIDDINNDKKIKAIIVEIDSYGGYPVAAEEITNALKRTTKPVIAVVREGAVSGAYLVATGADIIFASELSDIGGIGVTMSYLDYSEKHKREGIIYQEISSAEFKNLGSPDRELTDEEREVLREYINKTHNIFIRKVSENRNLEIEEVEKLADGFVMLGKDAKENKLIDEIGDIYSAKSWIKGNLNIDPNICIYR